MIRVILKDETSESKIRALSSGLVWIYKGIYNTEYSDELEYTTRNENCLIKYVNDKVSNVQYLILSADKDDGTPISEQKRTEQDVLARILTRPGAVTVVSGGELIEQFKEAKTEEKRADALIRLALDSVDYDAEIFYLLKQELEKDNPTTAKAIILGIGYMGWAQWKETLRKFSQKTQHPELKLRAERMLSGFELSP